MNRALLLLLSCAASALATLSPADLDIYDFSNDDISLALRAMARQGNFKISITGRIPGTVTLRADHKTPREVFDLIAAAKNLDIDEYDGVVYVRPKWNIISTSIGLGLLLALAVAIVISRRSPPSRPFGPVP